MGFVVSFPLPSDHWVYDDPVLPPAVELSPEVLLNIREAMKYTIQVCTSRGKDADFDPDAMWMTLEHTLSGNRQKLDTACDGC